MSCSLSIGQKRSTSGSTSLPVAERRVASTCMPNAFPSCAIRRPILPSPMIQRLIHQFTPAQFIPVCAARPDVTVLQTHHLRPCPVKHQHAAKNVLANRSSMNTHRRCHNDFTIRIENPGCGKPINARTGALEPAQVGSQLAPVVWHPVGAENFSLSQLA